MALDFQAEPFFDDYSEDKQFYQILFRPGYAVQARELNQLQTILAQQVKRHGDHIFKEGAMIIPGQIAYDLDVSYVKLDDSTNVNYSAAFELIQDKIIKNSRNVYAKVITSSVKEGSDPSTIFVRYLSSGTDNLGNSVSEFEIGDQLTLLDGTALPVTLLVGYNGGNASTASIQRGVYYIRGKFVLVPAQTIILDKYANTPSYRIGLQLTEEVVYPEDDETLLDNALGSPNYAAPGAARHYIDLVLTKLALNSITDGNFIDLLRLSNGKVIFKVTRTEYAELEKTLARRTFDESGDYALNPFNIKAREYRSNNRGPRTNLTPYLQGDIVTAPRGDGINLDYYVCTTEGITAAEIPAGFNPSASSVTDGTIIWEYAKQPIFNDGVYQFFSNNPAFASFTLNDHKRLASMVAYAIEPNKAYVKGYEIEKIATEYLPAFKSRLIPAGSSALTNYLGEASLPEINNSVSTPQTSSIDLSLGSYVIADSLKYAPDLVNFSTVNLYDAAYTYSSGAASGDIIGTARVRAIELHNKTSSINGTWTVTNTTATITSTAHGLVQGQLIYLDFTSGTAPADGYYSVATTPDGNTFTVSVIASSYTDGNCNIIDVAKDEYKVFLFDIQMNGQNKFDQVRAIHTTSGFKCNIVGTSATLIDPENFSLIYPIPDYAVKDINSITYTVVHREIAIGATDELEAPPGFVYESTSGIGNYYVIKNSDGTYQPYSTTGGGIILNETGNTLNVAGLVADEEYTIISTITTSANTSASTNLTIPSDYIQTITVEANAKPINRVYTLDKSNVTRIISVTMQGGIWGSSSGVYSIDITNRFTLDNGQYETHYANSTLRLKDSEDYPAAPIQITYEYINPLSDSAHRLFTVESYTHGTSNIAYEDIPAFKSYNLRDSLDFRPYASGAGLFGRNIPKFGRVAIVNYTKYLPRTDNLALTDRGQYIVSYGIPSVNPLEPTIPSNAMKLAIVDAEPYTFSTEYGLKVTRIDNKRYTMRDIGKLENRIKDLEYYTSLSLLESDTNNLRITDSDGLDRFQSGFLVDSFSGQGIGNTVSPEWNASIDHKNRELRPFFSQRQVNLLEVSNSSGTGGYSYKVSGDIISIPLNSSTPEVAMITQAKASRDISVNPFDVATFRGLMYLNPWSDTWFATDRRPDIIINDDGQYNALVAKAEADGVLGTVWNAWQILFQGEPVTTGSRLDVISSAGQGNTFAKIDTELLNANNGFGGAGTLWRARSTFTTEELNAIGITDGRLSGTSASRAAAGARVLTIETDAIEITTARTGKRTFIEDRVDSRVVDDKVVETQIIPYIRPRAVLFNAKGLKPTTDVNAFFDGINVNRYIEKATVIEVSIINNTPYTFDVDRNCGTNVSNASRLVETPAYGAGTITVTNGSATVTGSATAFLSEFPSDETGIIIIDGVEYIVTERASNTSLTLATDYTGVNASGISYRVRIPGFINNEVEVAFTHGEVIRNTTVGSSGFGSTAIVVGQEAQRINASTVKYYLHLLNIKRNSSGAFFNPNDVLEGEYTDTPGNNGVKAQVRFVSSPAAQNTKLASGKIKTSYTGQLHGLFRIPNNPIDRFKTGVRELTFTSGDDSKTQGATDARAYYEANGLLEIKQRTIVSTRTANLAVEELAPEENRIIQTTDRLVRDTGWFDPLAQTFLVQEEGGAFLSSVDLFFSAKDDNIPVRIEIREVVNGYPGQKVLPFSRVQKSPAEIFTSANGTVATKFTFVSPVYVQEYTEYAIVILSDSARYFVHISRSGDTDYNGDPIRGQPYNGVFFVSQNSSTWSASQEDDLKFVLNKAQFQVGTYKAKFAVPKLGLRNLDFNPLYLRAGENKIRVFHRNHGFKNQDLVTLSIRQHVLTIDAWTINDIFGPQGNGKSHQVTDVEEDAYVITLSGAATATGRIGGAYIYATENYEYATAMLDVTNVSIAGTDVKYKLISRDWSNTNNTLTIDMVNKENYNFESSRVLRYGNEINDLILEADMTTNNPNLSPVIDTGRISLTMVNNKVDSPIPHTLNDEELDTIELVASSTGNLITGSPTATKIQVSAKEIRVHSDYSAAYNNLSQLRAGSTIRFGNGKYFFVGEKYFETNVLVVSFADLTSSESSSEVIEDINLLNELGLVGGTTAVTRKIDWISHYNSEISVENGSVTSKYVTKKINLKRSSDMLRIMFSALIPNAADVEVYYKTGQSIDSDFISSRYYRAVPTSSYTKSDIKFNNLEFDVEGLDPFNSVIVKLVMRSTNTAKVPRIKDFRVIACAV